MPDDTTKTDNQTPSLGSMPTNQPDPAASPAPPVPPTVDTPPPPIQDGAQSPPPPIVEEEKPKEPKDEKKSDSPTTPDIPPVISTSNSGGRKPVSKKMIATILGVLVIVGGVGAGVILVQRQQDIREKAYIVAPIEPIPCSDAGGVCITTSTSCNALANNGLGCSTGYRCCSTPIGDDGPETGDVPEPTEAVGGETACAELEGTGYRCIPVGQSSSAIACGPYPGCDAGEVCCLVPPGDEPPPEVDDEVAPAPSSPPSTVPPGLICNCLDIKAYDDEWNLIANTNLSSLVAGDVVRFTVSGNASSGVIDMARFTINDVLGPEITDKKPGTDEFYTEYTIPEAETSFKIEAQLHHPEVGWF